MSEEKTDELTETFDEANDPLTIDATFKSKKLALGKVVLMDRHRIPPTQEDQEMLYGYTEEQFAQFDENSTESVKENFILEQSNIFLAARQRTINAYEDARGFEEAHGMVENSDIKLESLGIEIVILQDSGFEQDIKERISSGQNAKLALDNSYQIKIDDFLNMKNDYLAQKAVELEQHRIAIQHNFPDAPALASLQNIEEGSVLTTSDLKLTDLSYFMDPETGKSRVAGIITDKGSMGSHAASLANGMGIPYVKLEHDQFKTIKNGDKIILDGEEDKLRIAPSTKQFSEFQARVEAQQANHEKLNKRHAKHQTVKTQDGDKIKVSANYGSSVEAHLVKQETPHSIGLYRTEIAINMRQEDAEEAEEAKKANVLKNKPSPEKWQEILHHNIKSASQPSKALIPMTIRTLDIGGDKSRLKKDSIEPETTEVTATQMTAFLRLNDQLVQNGEKNKIKVMIPNIESAEHMQDYQKLMQDTSDETELDKVPLGCMIEKVSILSELDKVEADFWSVGTNDLMTGILGVNRYETDEIDPTKPAVLEAFEKITTTAEDRGIPVSVCGDLAADPKYTAMLIGAGFDHLSVGPDRISYTKEIASRVDKGLAQGMFQELRAATNQADKEEIINTFNETYLGLNRDGYIDMDWTKPSDKEQHSTLEAE